MTITFTGGTGVSTTGGARGTTSTTVAYNNVSAGRMAVLTVAVKPNTATINTPTDAGGNTWTKLGEGTGGTGTNAADTGQTKVAKFFRILSGSESGNITATGTSSGSIQAVLDVYSKTRASWDLSQYATASDATHGTNHSAASGTFGDYGINDTDWLLVGHSGDTDDSTTATSAPTIVQTGSTIGTVAARSETRNTSGNQGRTATWSAPVTTAGSNTSAVTAGFTWSVSSCGPDIIARLREYDEFNTLTDAFPSTLDSAKWVTGGTAGTSGGALVLNISGYSYVQSVGNYRLVNNAVTVHTTDFPTTGSTYYAGMRVGPRSNGGSDFIGIYYHGDGTISFEQTGTGAVSITLDETAHQWIRIKHDGTNVLLQTSPDGSAWTTQRTILAANFAAWVTSNGLEVVMEGAEGDSWSLDDFNLAPTLEVHTTSGTATTTVTASAAVATTRTVARTASTTVAATATRATVRTTTAAATTTVTATATRLTTRAPAGTATTTVTATAARAGAHTTTGTATTTVTATAVAGGARPTARTATVTVTASATRSTTRTTAGTASVTASASASVVTARTTARTAGIAVTATAVAGGARPTARTAPVTVTASATRSTTRAVARVAPVTTTAASTNSSSRVTSGTAQVMVVATGVVEGEEAHPTTGTASVAVTATAARSTTRATARTATANVAATAARSTSRGTTGSAPVAVTATAVSEATEAHTTSGAALAHLAATASATGVHLVARIGPVSVAATATEATTRATAGSASVALSATAATGSGKSGHPRIVDGDRLPTVVAAGRQSRIVDSTRPRRRTS